MHRYYYIIGLVLATIVLLYVYEQEVVTEKKISVNSLLQEMVSRETIARLPMPAYKNLQASSYDRRTVNRNKGWHANGDRSYFVNVEQNKDGRYEHVMLDVKGPGAIVRWWCVTSKTDLLGGTLRIYIDNVIKPTFSGTLKDLIGGHFFAKSPLSMALANESEEYKQGRNLYLPIPFAKSIKVTYERKDGKKLIEGEQAWPNDAVFYNINYRLYENTVEVESLNPERFQAVKALIQSTNKKLLKGTKSRKHQSAIESIEGKIAPRGMKEIKLEKPSTKGGAINQIMLKIDAENVPQALRSTVLEITFDGERTVWAPVGDFFGTGYQIRVLNNWYTTVDENGLLTCRWMMPFADCASIKLHNLGDQEVEVALGEISLIEWTWDRYSMHFGAAWKQYTNVSSKPDRDLNYVRLEGEGVYVGDVLTLFDTSSQWWGEGDEKIFVDNEKFPSHFGTGSEDYYGYAWCLGKTFSTPFVMQPDGSGNETIGYTVNGRYRLLDGIPFCEKIHFDMELQHWTQSTLNYAPTVFWYARPGIKCNIDPDPETALLPVALTENDITNQE
ncbi:DUF2961 domain-containing protein [Prolixibacteraceae bacterium JC049]|nr:DUF2961 domain-containing protein [Prolixibacteraceae bacterium JC049]